MAAKSVDEYVAGLSGWQAEVVARLRAIVREAAPEAEEAVKWAQPVYSSGGPFCFIRAHAKHVNLGFWRGVDLDDPERLLEGDGEKMRHVKVTGPEAVRAEAFTAFVRQALRLNAEKGDPTKG
jgi:hypothetical protein